LDTATPPTPSAFTPPPPPPPVPAEKPTDETIKETLESIVIAFILAFVFRAYVVEAFVIPTGSMAPTLLGEHRDITCDQCGYRYSLDLPDKDYEARERRSGKNPHLAACPMCHNVIDTRGAPTSAGDRILVHKYLYSIADPKRWDVVVFKNPQDPSINYIKRLVGLPGERLWIIDGNIYTSRHNEAWRIARKSDRPKVQRAVWQPIYHSQYLPLDAGRRSGTNLAWKPPWIEEEGEGWVQANPPYDSERRVEPARAYRYGGTGPATIRFDFEGFLGVKPGLYPYNQLNGEHRPLVRESLEDVRIAAAFQPDTAGLSVALETTARVDALPKGSQTLDPRPWTLRARIAGDGKASLEAVTSEGELQNLGSVQLTPLEPGRPTKVEFWFVDQELSLWVDGVSVLEYEFELPKAAADDNIDLLAHRALPTSFYPRVRVSVAGSPVTLHAIELDRDLYYTDATASDPNKIGTGVLVRRPSGTIGGEPIGLGPDDFFCLGDNSPRSSDGRMWNSVNPWIEERIFKNNLEATNDLTRHWGIVPRKLMMGRAFFVYFPAPKSLTPKSTPLIPNFGDMRFIH
jgi:signal peptidase I